MRSYMATSGCSLGWLLSSINSSGSWGGCFLHRAAADHQKLLTCLGLGIPLLCVRRRNLTFGPALSLSKFRQPPGNSHPSEAVATRGKIQKRPLSEPLQPQVPVHCPLLSLQRSANHNHPDQEGSENIFSSVSQHCMSRRKHSDPPRATIAHQRLAQHQVQGSGFPLSELQLLQQNSDVLQ